MTDLAMIVPTRGRPGSVARMHEAWSSTGGFRDAHLIWVLDADDPEYDSYRTEIGEHPCVKVATQDRWTPMVPKLDLAARLAAGEYPVVGFMGDDHLPRSTGWAPSIAAFVDASKPSIVYGRDGLQDQNLPTWWAMSSDIVKALGRMVPAPVQHMYCDNSILQLGQATNTIAYLPHVLIEHMHPVAGKAEWDEGYKRVNRRQQYDRDQDAYRTWLHTGLQRDATLLRRLRGV